MEKNSERSYFSEIRRRRSTHVTNNQIIPKDSDETVEDLKKVKKYGKKKHKKGILKKNNEPNTNHSTKGPAKTIPNWDVFDHDSSHIFDEEIASASESDRRPPTRDSVKVMQEVKRENTIGLRQSKNFNFKIAPTNRSPNDNHADKKKAFEYIDEEDDEPIEVYYQDLNNTQVANKLPNERITKTSVALYPASGKRLAKKNKMGAQKDKKKRKKKSDRAKVHQNNNIEIKMEESFEKDLLRRTNVLTEKNGNNRIKVGSDKKKIRSRSRSSNSDESLSLSPIKKQRLQTDENEESLEEMDEIEYRRKNYNTVASVKPLYRPTVRRKRNSNENTQVNRITAKTEIFKPVLKNSTFIKESANVKKRSYTTTSNNFDKKRYSTTLPQQGFRDLIGYANFREVSYDIPGAITVEYKEESYGSTQNIVLDRDRDTFVLPDQTQQESRNDYESWVNVSRMSKSIRNMKSDCFSRTINPNEIALINRPKSGVRRYGKYKNEREAGLSINGNIKNNEVITFNKRKHDFDNDDYYEQKELLYASASPSKKRVSGKGGNVYQYEVDEIDDFTPDRTDTLRNKDAFADSHRVDSLRPYSRNSPQKDTGGSKLHNATYGDLSPFSSGRKTVRFAEDEEGLLKSVAVDPSFNESDFVHDMHINY
ncbi:unnamed protein product [Moneuplotes crassus]|uniref:Uncharacterized protein n=1 Tax=Euplotes crassus TaxID=5936 RepID=A0AAD1U4Q9_EUPCR|nr:unnamed protein product [Moneuplotes crassus]